MISVWEIRLIFFKECQLDTPGRKIERRESERDREKKKKSIHTTSWSETSKLSLVVTKKGNIKRLHWTGDLIYRWQKKNNVIIQKWVIYRYTCVSKDMLEFLKHFLLDQIEDYF